MHTYLTTGSRNPEDYSKAPDMPLDKIPSNEDFKCDGYKDLRQIFSFNEEAFDSVEASFSYTDRGCVIYRYYMDSLHITVEYTSYDDLVDCYAYKRNKTVSEMNVKNYSSSNYRGTEYELRKQSDFDVLYYNVDGMIKVTSFIIDNCFITINGTYHVPDDGLVSKCYETFMSDPKYAPFAAFFSDDDATFESAVKALEENIKKSK